MTTIQAMMLVLLATMSVALAMLFILMIDMVREEFDDWVARRETRRRERESAKLPPFGLELLILKARRRFQRNHHPGTAVPPVSRKVD